MIPYALRPRPAPDCWPMPYHRNMAEVMAEDAAIEHSLGEWAKTCREEIENIERALK